MIHVLLLAHSPLASALMQVAGHVYPEGQAALSSVDVDPDESQERVVQRLETRLAELGPGDELLILVDVFGATPCNAAQQLAQDQRVRVVAGVNVPMLWRTLCYRNEPLWQLVERASLGGGQGVVQVSARRHPQQTTATGRGAHDQVNHCHQQ